MERVTGEVDVKWGKVQSVTCEEDDRCGRR